MVRLAISTDSHGHSYNATLIASILRRTEQSLHVRCWCRGFAPESFEQDRLKVEFIPTNEEVTGKFPSKSGPAAYDRLRVIRDCPDWDRCLIMDYDQLALCDLAPLFELDLGNHLLAAHMQGPGIDMDYAMRVWLKRPIPDGWEHVAKHPYFLMPPLLNLKAMRESNTWEKFLATHAAFGADEQLSLTAATEGRSLPLDRKWNLFPRLHIQENEVPEGVIHWSGWPKPWHRNAKVWRPDIWESERCSWEHLRMGLWEKPVALEVEPENDRDIRALAVRGWKVKVFSAQLPVASSDTAGASDEVPTAFPDVEYLDASPARLQSLLRHEHGKIDSLRLGPQADPAAWLEGCGKWPEHLTLKGEREADEINRLRQLGFTEEVRLMTTEWPAGGPMPRALDFQAGRDGAALGAGEELILKRAPKPLPVVEEIFEPQPERSGDGRRQNAQNARKGCCQPLP